MIFEKLKESVAYIKSVSDLKPRVGITLGSGLSDFAESIDIKAKIAYKDIPHFAPTSIQGHPGQLILGHIGETPVAILQGRLHYYEGLKMEEVVYPTRVIAQLGIEALVLTNAAGGLDPKMEPGDFMIIDDHINLTGNNPLIGPNIKELGLRFPDMSEPYDRILNEKLSTLMKNKNVRFSQGVYCGVSGPTYETAAEVRYLHMIGGHAVGMSTVPETITAKHMGLRVCGLSCITNKATGLSDEILSHDDVKDVAARVQSQFSDVLREFIADY